MTVTHRESNVTLHCNSFEIGRYREGLQDWIVSVLEYVWQQIFYDL